MEYLITDKHSWTEAAAWSLNANALAAVDESPMKWEGCSAGKSQQQSRKPEKHPKSPAGAPTNLSVHGDNARQHQLALLNLQAEWQQPKTKQQTIKAVTSSWRGCWLRCDTEYTMFVPPTSQGHIIFLYKPNAALLSSWKRRSYITRLRNAQN